MIACLSYSQDSLTNDTSYMVSGNRIRVSVLKMIRAEQLVVEVDSLLLINQELTQQLNRYKSLVGVYEQSEENLSLRIYKYESIIELDSLALVTEKKQNKKKRIIQGVVTTAVGIIIGVLISLR